MTTGAAGPAVPKSDAPAVLLDRLPRRGDSQRGVAHHHRLERILRIVRFLAAVLVLSFGNALPNIGEPFVVVLGVFIGGYAVIVIVLWARARTPEAVEWASHLTLAADIGVVGFALLVYAKDPGWTAYASGFLVIATAGLRFRYGAVLAALSLSLTYVVVTAFRVIELGIPVGVGQLGVQLATYLLAGLVLNQILPELETLRSRERDLYEPVLTAQEETGEAVVIAESGRPVFWNKAFASLVDRGSDEVGLVASISDLVVADPGVLNDAVASRRPFGGGVVTRDGRRIPVEISLRGSASGGRERSVWILREVGAGLSESPSTPKHDALTGLPNSTLFKKRAAELLSWAHGKQREVSLLIINLDGFRRTNDDLGREAGDQILVEVAARLSRTLRESDMVGRIGDDEFVALLPDISGPEAERVAQGLLRTISGPIAIGGDVATVGASIGISLYPRHAQEVDDLIRLADTAMTEAKHARSGWRTAKT